MSLKYRDGYNNQFGVNGGVNEFMMTGLVPMTPMFNMVVTIHYPILPSIEEKKKVEVPNITPTLALALLPQYKELLVEGSDTLVLFNYFFEFAKNLIDFEVIREDVMLYEQLVAYHTGHNFEMHLRAIKDEAHKVSLNAEVGEKDIYLNDSIKLLEQGVDDEFSLTWCGKRFVQAYDPFVSNKIKGGYNRYGKYTR